MSFVSAYVKQYANVECALSRETADKLIRGNGKFEELMAASQEIAAACAQLVVASRVKASSSSENLARLSKSSKAVLTSTGNVIATTKHCNKLIEESGEK